MYAEIVLYMFVENALVANLLYFTALIGRKLTDERLPYRVPAMGYALDGEISMYLTTPHVI